MDATPDDRQRRGIGAAEGLIALVVVLGALHVSASIFAPVAFAVLIIMLVWPLQMRLQAMMPKLLALLLSMIVTLTVFGAFGYLVTWGFGRVLRALIADAARFQALYEQLVVWLDGHGVAVAGLWTEHFNVGWMLRVVQGLSGRLNTMLSFWLVVAVYVLLGLLEVDTLARKAQALRNRTAADVLMRGGASTAAKLRRYMVVRTQMSILTGALVGVVAAVAGLPLAPEWGVIAFALNYIPFLGPLVATTFPTLFALAQFDTWQAALVILVCLNLVQFVVGSYIEPRISGSVLSISPFIVLFSVFFWAFLWGIFGAFIGVPITIAVLSFCEQHPSSRWVVDLFGGEKGAGSPGDAQAGRS